MFKILSVAIVCALIGITGAWAGPTQINVAEKNLGDEQSFQSLHYRLASIDNKLRNLENTVSVQCATVIDGKIEHYGRKIDNIERDLSRFQAFMAMELDKISENISSRNFRDDIAKDRTTRKIDAVYERIRHKLSNIEGQIDIAAVTSHNAREIITSKLEKLEENLTIRDADMEAELADAVAAIDDLKTTCVNMEENIVNITKESVKMFSKTNEKMYKKQQLVTVNALEEVNKSLSQSMVKLERTFNTILNQSNDNLDVISKARDELNENLNEYAIKFTDMYLELWKKSDTMETMFQNVGKVLNLTRSEQQNGLRALMVQVGRQSGKKSEQGDLSSESRKLDELNQRMDINFEKILLAQNLFLESCHRVQMDEPQLESQISLVLHQLIDLFEDKVSVGPKDIQKLEHLIRTHDSTTKENFYKIINALVVFQRETVDGKIEMIDSMSNHKLQLEAIYILLEDLLSYNYSNTNDILDVVQNIQVQLNKTDERIGVTQLQINQTNNFLSQRFQASAASNNAKLEQMMEFITNVNDDMSNIDIRSNKSYLDYLLKIKVASNNFAKQNTSYVGSNKSKMLELIAYVFGKDRNKRQPCKGDTENYVPKCNSVNASTTCNNVKNESVGAISNKNTNLNNGVYKLMETQNSTSHSYNSSKNNDCENNCSDLVNIQSGFASHSSPTPANLVNNTVTMQSEDIKSHEMDLHYETTSEFFTERTVGTNELNEDTTYTSTSEPEPMSMTIAITEKWDISTAETQKDGSATEESQQILEESYVANFEEDLTESNNEYTDHEYD